MAENFKQSPIISPHATDYMKDNLENISFDKVIATDGTNYAAFRKSLKPVYSKAWRDLAKGYFFLALLLVINVLLIKSDNFFVWAAIPVSAFLIGYTLAYLHLFIHAAAHYNLHPNKQKNDLISDYLIGVFFGIQQKNYRKIHWMHHTNLGTKDDTEHSYFNELNILFLLKCVTGIHTLSIILGRKKNTASSDGISSSIGFYLYLLLFHAVLLAILFLSGGWLLVITWLLALIVVFPILATIRQLLEHRHIKASGKINYKETNHGKVSRLFGNGVIDSSFGAAGFNRHLLHHWDPTISYTSLSSVENYLLNCADTADIVKESKTSYLKTFFALFKF